MDTYTRLINKAEDYIENHLGDVILLKDLADHVGFSPYHFHRIFSEHNTERVQQFVQRIKLERSAMVMITNPSISITELASLYAYSESSSYCRAFKKHFKCTPREYRKKTARCVDR